jgi:hypothetical protein
MPISSAIAHIQKNYKTISAVELKYCEEVPALPHNLRLSLRVLTIVCVCGGARVCAMPLCACAAPTM